MTIVPDNDLVPEKLATEANAPEAINRHRTVVRRPLTSDPVLIAAFSGKLRHELEHARQWNACGLAGFQLSNLADTVLAPKLTTEQDANAASAMFLRARWREAITALLDDLDHGPLARSLTPPGSLETLLARMVAFLYLYEDSVQSSRRRGPSASRNSLTKSHPGRGTYGTRLEPPPRSSIVQHVSRRMTPAGSSSVLASVARA
jgi:hypothetical protein